MTPIILLLVSIASASPAPPGMTRFNVLCPAPVECAALIAGAKDCRARPGDTACAPFLGSMKRLSAEYDCQRSFDTGYIVPAFWLCEDAAREGALELLASLKVKAAKAFYASSDFRRTLDGHAAETHFFKSLELEKKLKKK